MRLPTLWIVPLAGFVVAIVATVVLIVALPVSGGRGEKEAIGDAQRVEVAAVVSGLEDADLVVLRAVGGEALVPVPVSAAEGARIRDGQPAGGRSLLEEAVAALGGRIEAAVVDAAGGELTARLIVADERKSIELPASAAEAIAAAVETGRPLYTTRRVIESSPLDKGDLGRLPESGGGAGGPAVTM